MPETKTAAELAAEMQTKLNAAVKEAAEAKAALAELEKKTAKAEDMEAAQKALKNAEEKAAQINANVAKLSEQINEIKMGRQTLSTETKTFAEAFEKAIKSEEFRAGVADTISKKKDRFEYDFEVKSGIVPIASQSADTPAAKTLLIPGIANIQIVPNAFLDDFSPIPIPAGKNVMSYHEGNFVDNTGYADEMTEMVDSNSATMEQKDRALAKIGSFTPFSAEALDDSPELVQWAQTKAQEAIKAKVDTLLWAGLGADTDAKTKKQIYGIKTQGATPFNADTSGIKVVAPNVADLVKAMAIQIQIQSNSQFFPDRLYIHPATLGNMELEKDKNWQYLMRTIPTGITIKPTAKIGVNELFVGTTSTLNIGDKRAFTLELERVAKTDSYILWLWWRGQGLVRNTDKMGNVYVSDISAALTAIEETTAEA